MSVDQAESLRILVARAEASRRPITAHDPHPAMGGGGASAPAAVPGGGTSNSRRRVRSESRAQVVAVTSGKGGVGKSNVSVNLAIRLSQMNHRVVLLDADLGTANIDVLCNISPMATLSQVIQGRRSLQDAIVEAPGGFRLIPGASGLSEVAALGEQGLRGLIDQVHALEADADVLLIDTGAGVGPGVLGFSLAADQVLVVTTPEPTAVTDAYAVIKSLHRRRSDVDIRVLVNMVTDGDEGRVVYERLASTCVRFLRLTPRYVGSIVMDPAVGLAVRRRSPFVLSSPGCRASQCIQQLAGRMSRFTQPPQKAGLLHRMASWLGGGPRSSSI